MDNPLLTVICTYIATMRIAKRRSIALDLLLAIRTAMTEEAVDLVAGDFNGTSKRQKLVKNREQTASLNKRSATL